MRRPDEWRGPFWEPRDIWIGVYWDRRKEREMNAREGIQRTDVYACLVPCFPIRLTWVSTYAVTFARLH